MITHEEFLIITSDEVQRAIASARGRDPLEVALDRTVPHARLVASQLKYLARAERKLPHYAAAGCILPSLAFEQSSSEECASSKRIGGGRVLDLTCGLGVDAWFLSRRFDRVVTLERNPLLAEVARENFRRLGAENIEVVNRAAEDYVAECREHFDWIYADPDRRGADGRKLVRLEDCSPDMVALMPRLKELSGRICIKNSPLFDVDEAFRLFGACGVEVLSVGDECKEVVITIDPDLGDRRRIRAVALGRGEASADYGGEQPPLPQRFDGEEYRWLVIPDVALQKARMARRHLEGKADIWSDNGFGFAREEPHDVVGRVVGIEQIMKYDPRHLKREWKGLGAEILKRDFPLRTEEIFRRTGLHAGGDLRLAFTKIGSDYWVIRLK